MLRQQGTIQRVGTLVKEGNKSLPFSLTKNSTEASGGWTLASMAEIGNERKVAGLLLGGCIRK
jgi:hypothetical protein